jgi:hypothetical protein
MPTTVQFALPTPRSRTKRRDPFAHIGFGFLIIWAAVMLSIGAAARFGMQSPELSTPEHSTLY